MSTKISLPNWLRQLVLTEHESGPVSRAVLRHVSAGKVGADVLTFDVPDEPTADLVEDIASQIELAAEGDADGLGGVQSYVVHAYRGKSTKSAARKTFRVAGDVSDHGDLSSEPPTATGIVTQLMRHNEVLMRAATQGQAQVSAMLSRQLEAVSRRNSEMEDTRISTIETMENLLSQRHERDLDEMKATQRAELMDRLVSKTELLLPAVASKLTGKPLSAENHPQTLLVKELASSIKPDQFEKLSKIFNPEQLVALGNLFSSVNE